jgi:transmembrane sensor
MAHFDLRSLLEKYRMGTCSQEEKALLESWYLEEIKKQNIQTDQMDFDQIGSQLWDSVKDRLAKENSSFRRPATTTLHWFRIAAIFLLLVGIALFVLHLTTNTEKPATMLIGKSGGKTTKIILSDGSIIWLKGKSSLHYPSRFTDDQRIVTLEGEALFEIARDSAHPFIVHCEKLTARVLGTSFNIRAHAEKIEVALFTGKIELVDEKKQKVTLKPHEKASYLTVERKIVVKKSEPEEQAACTLGTLYDMHFDDSPISDVTRRIEDKFNVHVRVIDNSISELLITADFTGQPLAQTLRMIGRTLQVQCELKNDTVFLREKY